MRQKLLLILLTITFNCFAQSWQSKLVYFDADSNLVYVRDSLGNVIPDFSYAGYKNGNEPIPDVPVVKTISPIDGDNTNAINSALFEIGMMTPDADGIRGALFLEPGEYQVNGTLKLQYDGVVLRGSGDGADISSNTVIKAVGNSPNQRTVLLAGGGASTKWSDQTNRVDIISDTVLIGTNSFRVKYPKVFSVGDNVIITHPCTQEWLEAIDYGGTHSDGSAAESGVDVPWSVSSQPLVFNRYITKISGDTVWVDVPIYNTLIRSLSQSYIAQYQRQGIRTNIGIENLRIDIEFNGSDTDEKHAWNAIDLYLIEDAWVKNCTMLHFGLSGIRTNTATRITIDSCSALYPKGKIEGGKRYNFNTYTASQQILFSNCAAQNGRHHYVSNGMSWNSGNVFYNSTSKGAYTSSEGHRRWSMGYLWDNHRELDGPRPGLNPRLLGLYNRGYYGTSHGWAIANSVAWNCDVNNGDLIVQKPPTAQNYAIGCFGNRITGRYNIAPFDEPEGYIEGKNTPGLNPPSLYIAQYNERMKNVTSVKRTKSEFIPTGFTVEQNYPNPFNPETTIKFQLPGASRVKVRIFNMLGELVTELDNSLRTAGVHFLQWNGTNDKGERVNSGIYFYSISSVFGTISKKMMVLK